MYIREEHIDKEKLLAYAYENIGLNYFILLGLSISKMVYQEVIYFYPENTSSSIVEVILLKRRSGNLQLLCRKASISSLVKNELREFLTNMTFKELITSQKNVALLGIDDLFTQKEDGALIACATHLSSSTLEVYKTFNLNPHEALILEGITPSHVEQIEALYKLVFDSFTPPRVMIDKLETKRGRGLALYKSQQMVAVAQTDFETSDGAIIVGVATAPTEQHKGYGHLVMALLCKALIDEGKTLYLHYNNPIAGKLYEKMGFHIIDQIGHYKK